MIKLWSVLRIRFILIRIRLPIRPKIEIFFKYNILVILVDFLRALSMILANYLLPGSGKPKWNGSATLVLIQPEVRSRASAKAREVYGVDISLFHQLINVQSKHCQTYSRAIESSNKSGFPPLVKKINEQKNKGAIKKNLIFSLFVTPKVGNIVPILFLRF